MRMPKQGLLRLGLATVCGSLILLASTAAATAQQNSEQVVFSGVASVNSTFALGSPAGFWIWCESEASNPYEGNCAGSMYFYALGVTKGVSGDDAITEHADGTYTMTVHSSDGSVNCSLTNFLPVSHGPANRVDVACSTPAGSATALNAVVNVTGP